VPGINMLDQASAGAQAAPTLAHERILPITAAARHPGRTAQNPVRQADLRAILSGQCAEHGLIVDQRRSLSAPGPQGPTVTSEAEEDVTVCFMSRLLAARHRVCQPRPAQRQNAF